jgi:integrase
VRRRQGSQDEDPRDIIDGTFRALYRDARTVDRLVGDDPFAALRWPRKIELEPDPFTAEERDKLLDHLRHKATWYFPFVHLLFWTGIRVGEAVGLRWGDVDLRGGKLSVRRSRTLGEDNAPKTARSVRTITLRPEVIAVLRAMPASLHRTEQTFVFVSQAGQPLDEERFVEKHWHRALRATGVRPRKFYATRHTFISLTLMAGAKPPSAA